jgi:uncharacterized RDD family membrane protein YckC
VHKPESIDLGRIGHIPEEHSRIHETSTSYGDSPIQPRWAGFWVRGIAYFIDLFILSLLYSILALVGRFAMRMSLISIHLESPSDELVLFLSGIYIFIWFLLFCAYFIFFYGYTGQTPGKMLFRIRVLQTNQENLTWKKALQRTAGYFISGPLLFGLGFLLILFHPRKRSLHDLIAGTLVIRE